MSKKRYDNNCIMFFSDTHAPYHHKHTLEFLSDINSDFNPDRVICGGDLGDIYQISNYPKDIDHPDSWHKEIKGLRKFVKELSGIFPKLEVLESNHDSRPYRRSTISGIPREFLVPYKKVLGAPEDWVWKDYISLTVDSDRSNWFFVHTINGGQTVDAAKQKGTNVCIGHKHQKFGAQSFNTGKTLLWGVDGGCLVSDKGSAFAYNKSQVGRPIQGCCVIVEGTPHMVPLR